MSDRNKKFLILAIVLNVILVLCEIIALVLSSAKNNWSLLQYYTEDSNILAMIVSIIFVIYGVCRLIKNIDIPKWLYILRYIATCMLTITFLVVVFVLIPWYSSQGGYFFTNVYIWLFSDSMLYHHFLCPVISFISFVFLENQNTLSKKDVLYTLVTTIIYGIVLIILNICKVVNGPYPFLQVYNQSVLATVLWCICILAIAYLVAFVIYAIKNRVIKKGVKKEKN